jgi:hypothetical protein
MINSRLALPVVLLILVGCGGGGGGAAPIPAGRYVGSWTGDSSNSGTAEITIAVDRTISGILNSDLGGHFGPGGEAQGTLVRSGKSTINGIWPTADPDVTWVLIFRGTLRYNSIDGTLHGTLSNEGEVPVRTEWTLTRQP